jgi:LmbE family N-acetylglucosaminyl deacetylase
MWVQKGDRLAGKVVKRDAAMIRKNANLARGSVGADAVANAYARSIKEVKQPFRMPTMEDIAAWKGKKALVFAPHQDDEVLGCGGTIARMVDQGIDVAVAYLTDGRRGSERMEAGLVEKRNLEALAGLKVLGCETHHFLGFEDGRLETNEETLDGVRDILQGDRPDLVFLPHITDGPSDHVVTSMLVSEALRDFPGQVVCFNYEVWNPLQMTTLVDISEVMPRKVAALREHRSQLKVVDFEEKVMGLNAYRSMCTGSCRYCEAFHKLDGKEQVRFMDEFCKSI